MNKPRKPWLAAMLTLLTIGLGHIYCGEGKKGILLFCAGQLFLVLGFVSFLCYPPVGPIILITASLLFILYCMVDSVKVARRHNISYTLKNYNKWYVYFLCCFLGSFVIQTATEATVKTHIAQAYKIPAGSMLNTLQIGDHIIANKFIFTRSQPQRGDIVVLPFPKDPSIDYVKRVIGLGGETIEIRNKDIYINGIMLKEDYVIKDSSTIIPKDSGPRDNLEPLLIPNDSLFVLGDNRDNSYDSRFFGYVKRESLKAKVIYIYWSWDKDNLKVRWNRIGKTI